MTAASRARTPRRRAAAGGLRTVLRVRDARIAALEREVVRLRRVAARDSLTGLATRRSMESEVKRILALRERDPSHAVALIIADVDRLKRINDRFGHPAGDAALRRLGALIRRQTRGSDLGIRFGGDEFAIFIHGRSAPNAPLLAERIRAAAANLRLPGRARGHRPTLSLGVVRLRPKENFARLLARADRLLYRAKRRGRNRVEADTARPARRTRA